jgi:hypothetical protein
MGFNSGLKGLIVFGGAASNRIYRTPSRVMVKKGTGKLHPVTCYEGPQE